MNIMYVCIYKTGPFSLFVSSSLLLLPPIPPQALS